MNIPINKKRTVCSGLYQYLQNRMDAGLIPHMPMTMESLRIINYEHYEMESAIREATELMESGQVAAALITLEQVLESIENK